MLKAVGPTFEEGIEISLAFACLYPGYITGRNSGFGKNANHLPDRTKRPERVRNLAV